MSNNPLRMTALAFTALLALTAAIGPAAADTGGPDSFADSADVTADTYNSGPDSTADSADVTADTYNSGQSADFSHDDSVIINP